MRELCTTFPSEYWRELDEQHAYPEEFVKALTEAGWLAALIPDEYGGGGLGITEASVILEEINRSGATPARATRRCTSWARCCATDRRSRSSATCRRSLAVSCACRRSRVTEPTTGTDTTQHPDRRRAHRRPLRGQRPEGLDLARAALRPDAAVGAHHAARRGEEEDRGPVRVSRRSRGPSGHGITLGRSATWSTTRPTRCSSTISRSPRKT